MEKRTLILRAYRAAAEPRKWRHYLQEFSLELGFDGAVLALRAPSKNDCGIVCSFAIEPHFADAYRMSFFSEDPAAAPDRAHKPGEVEVWDPEQIERSAPRFLREWLLPQDLSGFVTVWLRGEGGANSSYLSCYRGTGDPRLGADASDVLHVLAPDLVRAAELAISVSEAPRADQHGESASRRLRERLGLTPAEARVALLLARGLSVKDIASACQVSIHTVRVQLYRCFSKTQTHRQAELVSLVLRQSVDGV